MQISDLFSQYNNSTLAGSQVASGTKGVEQVSNTVNQLRAGQTFEGSVTQIQGDKVTLSLSSGQSIQARLSDGVQLSQGESVFFEVKSNEGGTVQIRPVSFGATNNPALLSALDAASLPKNEQTVNMVNTMMQENMSIDAKSLTEMMKTLQNFPTADTSTVVLMKHYDIPVNNEMIAQFENYKANEGAIMDAAREMVDSMVSAFAGEDVSVSDVADFQKALVETLQLSGEDATESEMTDAATALSAEEADEVASQATVNGEPVDAAGAARLSGADGEVGSSVLGRDGAGSGEATAQVAGETGDGAATRAVVGADGRTLAGDALKLAGDGSAAAKLADGSDVSSAAAKLAGDIGETTANAAGDVNETGDVRGASATDIVITDNAKTTQTAEFPRGTIGFALDANENTDKLRELNQLVKQFPEVQKNAPQLFDENSNLRADAKTADVLNQLTTAFKNHPDLAKADLMKAIGSNSYKALVHNLMEDQWTVSPEDLKKENKIQNLYEKLETHLRQLEETAKQLSNDPENAFSKTAQNVRDNIDFMNQINHNFTYVQIPLKLSGQNATGDLYVYSNKKSGRGDDDTLTAFLHFDLDHLGSTDISVKMRRQEVDTKFFMENDAAFDLISENIGILEKKLNEKGYNTKITVENDEHPVNLIEDFVAKDAPVGGTLQRYSFDARA